DEVDALETMSDNVSGQRLEIDDNVGKFRQLLLQPLDDLLARPVMIVVQVQDDGVERQALVAADRTAAAHVLEAVEQAVESRPDRVRFLRIAWQSVRPLVRRAHGAPPALRREVLAERLCRAPLRAFGNGLSELELIGARHLMHGLSRSAEAVNLLEPSRPPAAFYAPPPRRASVRK